MTVRGLVAFGHPAFASDVGRAISVHLEELYPDQVVDVDFQHVAVAPGDVAPSSLINHDKALDVVVILPPRAQLQPRHGRQAA